MGRISIFAVITCLWMVSISAVAQEPSQSPKDSVWIQREMFYPKEGPAREKNVRQRWVRADGAWKEIVTVAKPSGILESVAWSNVPPEIPGPRVKFNPVNPKMLSPDYLRSSSEFVREDELLGYKAYVWRTGLESNWFEQWYVPEVSGLPLKHVRGTPEGLHVIEPIRVDFRAVTEADLAIQPRPKN